MDTLHAALSSIVNPSQQVQQLLQQLEAADLKLDVCVCSVGGVGSTALQNFLTRHGFTTNLLQDQDNLRHSNRPPDFGAAIPASVVYLFGDPLPSVASHFRRGHALHQAQKTCGKPGALSAANFPASFEDYVERSEDLFGYGEHLENWLTLPTSYPILFVRYEHMHQPEVAAHLWKWCGQHKLDQAAVMALSEEWCQSYIPRKSQVTAEQRAQAYADLQQRIDQLPSIFVRRERGDMQPF